MNPNQIALSTVVSTDLYYERPDKLIQHETKQDEYNYILAYDQIRIGDQIETKWSVKNDDNELCVQQRHT